MGAGDLGRVEALVEFGFGWDFVFTTRYSEIF